MLLRVTEDKYFLDQITLGAFDEWSDDFPFLYRCQFESLIGGKLCGLFNDQLEPLALAYAPVKDSDLKIHFLEVSLKHTGERNGQALLAGIFEHADRSGFSRVSVNGYTPEGRRHLRPTMNKMIAALDAKRNAPAPEVHSPFFDIALDDS